MCQGDSSVVPLYAHVTPQPFYQARQPADAGAENGVLSTYEVVCHIALRIRIFVDLCSSLLFWTWFHHVSPRWFTIFAGQWFNGFWTLCLWMSFMISWLLKCGHVCFVLQHTYLCTYTYNISCFADFRFISCFFCRCVPHFFSFRYGLAAGTEETSRTGC